MDSRSTSSESCSTVPWCRRRRHGRRAPGRCDLPPKRLRGGRVVCRRSGPGHAARSANDTYAFFTILAAGYRIVYDPARIVWRRHRRDDASLRRILWEYTVSTTAYATRCLVKHREIGALTLWKWWWFKHFRRDLARVARRTIERSPPARPERARRHLRRSLVSVAIPKRSRRAISPSR